MDIRRTDDRKGFAIAGVPCFAVKFVKGRSSILRMNFISKISSIAKPRTFVCYEIIDKTKNNITFIQ